MTPAGFPHSDILGSRFGCQLPEAYRRLPRPSSAPSAKASTVCPYKLDHKDIKKMLASTVQFSSYDRTHPSQRLPRMRAGHPLQRSDAPTNRPARTTARPFPQDPTACPAHSPAPSVPPHEGQVLGSQQTDSRQLVDVPPLSTTLDTYRLDELGLDANEAGARCSLERR